MSNIINIKGQDVVVLPTGTKSSAINAVIPVGTKFDIKQESVFGDATYYILGDERYVVVTKITEANINSIAAVADCEAVYVQFENTKSLYFVELYSDQESPDEASEEEIAVDAEGDEPKKRYTDMTPDEQRQYKADNARVLRKRYKDKLENGAVPMTEKHTRELLADAALMILSKELPGHELIMNYLIKAHKKTTGAPMTLKSRIKSSKMKPKHLDIALAA